MNTEAFVAKKNIDRYYITGKLDVVYLDKLSTDASAQIKRLESEKKSEIQTLIKNKKFSIQDSLNYKDFRYYNYSISNAIDIFNINTSDILRVIIINNSTEPLNGIALTNDKETQVMASKLEQGQQCVFFIQDKKITSYLVVLTDANKKTYKQDISLNFSNEKTVTLYINDYDGKWNIVK
jgi:hypothetical protein